MPMIKKEIPVASTNPDERDLGPGLSAEDELRLQAQRKERARALLGLTAGITATLATQNGGKTEYIGKDYPGF